MRSGPHRLTAVQSVVHTPPTRLSRTEAFISFPVSITLHLPCTARRRSGNAALPIGSSLTTTDEFKLDPK